MMLQHNTNANEQTQYRNSVYALFVELVEVTDALTEKTGSDDLEALQLLVQRREECIRQLSAMHTMEQRSMMIYGSEDEQMKQIISRVKRGSEQMMSAMEQKSKTIVAKLSNLHHQRMYQQ